MAEGDIIAWAASYLGGEEGLAAAFADLAREGLFHRVLYSIFAVPVYYCSYDERFVDELPANIGAWITGATIFDLKAFWSAEFDENGDAFAGTWIYWGLCAGQGSQSGGSPTGPCRGPGCAWFIDGSQECNWGLQFADVPRTGWPDTSFLAASTKNVADEDRIEQSLAAWRKVAPELPWPKT
jgi:hypothetical protein